jgi:hypothetical protein
MGIYFQHIGTLFACTLDDTLGHSTLAIYTQLLLRLLLAQLIQLIASAFLTTIRDPIVLLRPG